MQRQLRRSIVKDVQINDKMRGYALDISEGGMYIYSHYNYPAGSTLDISFSIAEDMPPIRTAARVAFVKPGLGMGVAFSNLPIHVQERIRTFMKSDMVMGETDAGPGTTSMGKKVLIVNEDLSSRGVYSNMLLVTGFNVKEMNNSADIVSTIRREMPDLLLLDMEYSSASKIIRSGINLSSMKTVIISRCLSAEDSFDFSKSDKVSICQKMSTSPSKLVEEIKFLLSSDATSQR